MSPSGLPLFDLSEIEFCSQIIERIAPPIDDIRNAGFQIYDLSMTAKISEINSRVVKMREKDAVTPNVLDKSNYEKPLSIANKGRKELFFANSVVRNMKNISSDPKRFLFENNYLAGSESFGTNTYNCKFIRLSAPWFLGDPNGFQNVALSNFSAFGDSRESISTLLSLKKAQQFRSIAILSRIKNMSRWKKFCQDNFSSYTFFDTKIVMQLGINEYDLTRRESDFLITLLQ